ncbi:MAG: radical SAM protein [Muribaculaceae bacterium]|nr:radical SAM protein [Muribaculaceae bacterium]MDE5957532.1 radical SAM protein [Muribaculaceae bacterium]MDE7342483.1 radical SAM protein [Muribaculaceae bacterium]
MAKDQTVLFHSTVFGPIHSRRLGTSLGINLLPDDGKVCTFDCVYCEAGYNAQGTGTTGLPATERVAHDLEEKLRHMTEAGERLDVITFSGNGEPTLHPQFGEVVEIVNALRDKYFPAAKTSVLTNSTRIFDEKVAEGLEKVDNNILKLDSAIESTMRLIDNPVQREFTVERLVEGLKRFSGRGIIQTMFLRGEHDGKPIDNTSPEEVDALIAAYREIRPKSVMIYSLDRSTPEERLVKVERDELERIAARIREAGIEVSF